jgi:hypothetical protein
LAFGLWRAAAIDLVALLANSIGHLKRVLQGKRGAGVPHFIRDLFRHSVLWPSNRAISTPSTRYQSHRSDSPTA